jgi:DNA-binding beta-propeller fold protein YncE
MKRFLWLGFVLFLYLICSGCGDTFRPIIIPNPPTFPDPRAAHTVVSINDNGTVVPGSAMVIDVSGDTDMSVASVGLAPVHAVQQTANQVLVVNHSVTGPLNTADSITKLSFNGTTISGATTISLPPNSAPNFVATTESSHAYVLLPGYVPPSVEVVNTNTNSLVATIPVGNNPVAMAETPNSQKLYVANPGDNTVSGFNTIDRSPRTINGSFNAPLWVIARSDSQRVYVLNGSGVVSTIDTTSTAGPDNVIDASISAPGAAYMLYDANKNRLYIPGGRSTQLTILDVSQSSPQPLGGGPIGIPTVAPSSRPASDFCSLTSTQPLIVAAVAALPDGSRAYVGSYYEDAVNNVNYICPQVTVIDVASNTIKSYFAVPGFPAYDAFCFPTIVSPRVRFRLMMAAGGDSTRAYLSSCDGGNVNIIDTSSDTYILNLPAPIGSRPPILPSPQNPPQNPVFLIAGP